MNQSRSLDDITINFLSNAEMDELSPNDRKFVLNRLKKMYSCKFCHNFRVNEQGSI
jgi:hypothetical protein